MYFHVLQSIVEKMKMHALVTGSIEIQMNDKDKETEDLIQIQDVEEQRAQQR